MKNYVEMLDLNDCTKLLARTFSKNADIQIFDPEVETKGDIKKMKFGVIANDQLRFGEAYYGDFHYEVLIRYPNSLHGETMTVKKPYAQFMMDRIKERNENGDNTFNVTSYLFDYNEYIKREYDKQIQEAEKEYYDNILYSKDKPVEKGE